MNGRGVDSDLLDRVEAIEMTSAVVDSALFFQVL